MEKIISQITDHMVGLIKSDKPAYTPAELLKAGIPSFVVERVRLYLEDKVKEETEPGKSKWFNGGTKLVQDSWHDFLRSAISHSHVPKSELYQVLTNVVSDIIYVFIEPRKKMAEYLFREDNVLTFDELTERCRRLTIYKHFGTAIPLYMEKRELKALNKDRCNELIHKLDARLVDSYTAQDWAQKLEQLFILFGGRINPKLLTIFFEDKGLITLSSRFEEYEIPLSKRDFIKILSGEKIENLKPVETRPTSSVSQPGKQKEEESEEASETLLESIFGVQEADEPDEEGETLAGQFSEEGLTEDEMSELLTDLSKSGFGGLSEADYTSSLNELFSFSLEDMEVPGEEPTESDSKPNDPKEFRQNIVTILDQAKNSFEGVTEEEEPETEEVMEPEPEPEDIVEEPELTISEEEEIKDEDPESGEEKPIWEQFISPDQMDVIMGGSRSYEDEYETGTEEDEKENEEEEIAEADLVQPSVIEVEEDLSANIIEEPVPETEANPGPSLKELLKSRKEDFISVIFNGSEKEYEKAVSGIEAQKNWKETSLFIKEEIFNKYDVDMFDGATVDFTDRLHTYFNEHRST